MWGLGERDTHPNSMQNLGIRKREKKESNYSLYAGSGLSRMGASFRH